MFDFWKEANIGQSADIMASPENIPILENLLSEHGIHYTEMIKDVEVLHQSNLRDSLKIIKTDAQYDWNDYYSHAEINTFIDGLVSLLFLVCLYFLFTFTENYDFFPQFTIFFSIFAKFDYFIFVYLYWLCLFPFIQFVKVKK